VAPPAHRAEIPEAVTEALRGAQERGFIGPGDLRPHLDHALGFAGALEAARGETLLGTDRVVDLGSGGGLPGLVLAGMFGSRVILLEGSVRRAQWLESVVSGAPFRDSVVVVGERAELAGRNEVLRGSATVVVARSFGLPAETAECGAPLLRVGGHLVVSEPPQSDPERWPPTGLSLVGLEFEVVAVVDGAGYAVLRQEHRCPDRFPRRVGVPRKRPLF
jgi:16S rRNA (guanine527-N7)-methyltransferase